MASLTRWTWVWVNSGSCLWTGRPGVLRFMGSQRVGHDWVMDLVWSDLNHNLSSTCLHFIAAYFKSQITKKVDLFNKLNPFQEIIYFLVPVLLQSGRNWPNLELTQFSSVAQSYPTLCDPMVFSTPGFPVHQQLPELTQTHVYPVGDTIQPSHPLSSPSPHTFNISQYQDLFQRVGSSHQVAKILEFQLQQQSFQWIFRIDFL